MRASSVWGTLSLLFALAGFGCGGARQDVVRTYQAGGGQVRAYGATMVEAWDAARAALRWNNAKTIKEGEGWMVGTAPASWWGGSWGATMGIWLEPVDDEHTRARAVVSRRLAINVTAQSEEGLLDDIGRAIAFAREGRDLSNKRPK